MKYILAAGLTVYAGSTIRAASCDKPDSSGSIVPSSRLAEYPFAGQVRHDAGKDDDRGQKKARGIEHDNSETGTDEPGMLGYADADQSHQDRPQRSKACEVADQAAHDALQAVGTEQIDRRNQLAGLGVCYREVELAGKPAGNDNEYRE